MNKLVQEIEDDAAFVKSQTLQPKLKLKKKRT